MGNVRAVCQHKMTYTVLCSVAIARYWTEIKRDKKTDSLIKTKGHFLMAYFFSRENDVVTSFITRNDKTESAVFPIQAILPAHSSFLSY